MTTVVERLPAHPTSAGRARRLLADALRRGRLDDLVDVGSLLVSEVVTNALIHAGSEVTVSVAVAPGRVRVEVADRSPTCPVPRHYDDDAVTGRGLALLEALAEAWGAEARAHGKSVWFVLATDSTGGEGAGLTGGEVAGPARPGAGDGTGPGVLLARAPLRLIRASAQYADALLREAALMALGGEGAVGAEATWTAPAIDLAPLLRAVDEALERGETAADLFVPVPPAAAGGAVHRLGLVDEADRLAQEGALLSPPSLPELAACRRWYLGEVTRQLEGDPPTPWVLPDVPPAQAVGVLDPQQLEVLQRLPSGVIAADETNHVAFVNEEAAALLGWTVHELTGQRLTAIVPPELRDAHLAGYTRYLVTRDLHLAGAPVTLPALHRDGSTVEVTLELRPLAPGGSRFVVAVIAPAG